MKGDMKMAFKKLEPYFVDGRRKTADAGVAGGETKSVFVCECSGKVVWVKSKKTGKNYLADCFPYGGLNADYEKYWYAAHSPHFKSCEMLAAQRDVRNGY